MPRFIALVTAVILLGMLAVVSRAEIPNMSREDLVDNATHIVFGKVQRIYTSTDKEPSYDQIHGLAEVAVTKVEKGAGLSSGAVVYARYGNRVWTGKGSPPPGSSGHRGVPVKGNSVRVYLVATKDGGYEVLLPNGFEVNAK